MDHEVLDYWSLEYSPFGPIPPYEIKNLLVETKKLNQEVIDFIRKHFGLETIDSETDELSDSELLFKVDDSDVEDKVRKSLKSHFKGVGFHTTTMGGILAILIGT